MFEFSVPFQKPRVLAQKFTQCLYGKQCRLSLNTPLRDTHHPEEFQFTAAAAVASTAICGTLYSCSIQQFPQRDVSCLMESASAPQQLPAKFRRIASTHTHTVHCSTRAHTILVFCSKTCRINNTPQLLLPNDNDTEPCTQNMAIMHPKTHRLMLSLYGKSSQGANN